MNRTIVTAFLFAAGVLPAADTPSNPLVYVGAFDPSDGSGQFGTLNLTDGSFHLIRNQDVALVGMARSGGNIYGMDLDGNFYQINPTTGDQIRKGNAGVHLHNINGNITLFAGMPNGALFALDFDLNLYQIHPENGKATLIGNTGLTPITSDRFGDSLAADSSGLYFTYDMGQPSPLPPFPELVKAALYRIDPITGKAQRLSGAPDFISASAFVNGKLYLFRLNVMASGDEPVVTPGKLAVIDPKTGIVTELEQPAPCLGFVWGAIPAPAVDGGQRPQVKQELSGRGYVKGAKCRSCAVNGGRLE